MTDKKLTDAEITVKALKEILELMLCEGDLQRTSTISHTIDLINSLQADNIALNRRAMPSSGHIFKVGNALLFAENKEDYDITINAIKAEAYKECIEKAKEQCNKIPQYHFNLLNVEWYLDNLLKELVGDSSAD